MEIKTRYEEFKAKAKEDIDAYREKTKGNGSFEFDEQVMDLFKLQNNINLHLLTYLFGEQLGRHYAEKFVNDCNRNLLKFLKSLDGECRFYLLYELKTNRDLFAYC